MIRRTNKPTPTLSFLTHQDTICESMKNIGRKYGIAVYFKGNRTLKNLMSPKDKDEINKSSIIYSYCCGELGCDEEL